MTTLGEFLSPEAGQKRRKWLESALDPVAEGVNKYLGPTGIPERLQSLGDLLEFTDAGDYTAAAESSRNLWNEPTLGNAIDYATAGAALAVPFASKRMGEAIWDAAGEAARGFDPTRTNIFAGVNAKTADLGALERAKEMDAAGAAREKVWGETGWFRGVDGKWRFEIDDSGMTNDIRAAIEETDPGTQFSLGEVIDHPDLYAAYPEMSDRRANLMPKDWMDAQVKGAYGGVTGGGDVYFRDDMIDTGRPAHEMQHLVQAIEGFERGGSPSSLSFEDYQRLAGEVEARNVELRALFDAELRREVAPWDMQDVPDDRQIRRLVVRDGN